MPQVVDEGLTDVFWQRQLLFALPLAMHEELAGMPVDVAELQPGHLTGAEPQADEQG